MTWTLSKWLAAKTDHSRELLVASINTRHPATSNDNCRSLLLAHSQFLKMVEPMHDDPILERMFTAFLHERRRQFDHVPTSDPNSANQVQLVYYSKLPRGLIPRIGWLYTAAFVDRGLAQLSETAQLSDVSVTIDFEEHRRMWQSFKAELDGLYLSEADEVRLVDAVRSAFSAYCKLLKRW